MWLTEHVLKAETHTAPMTASRAVSMQRGTTCRQSGVNGGNADAHNTGVTQFLPKPQLRHFVAMDKIILKFTQKGQGTKTANINFKQKNTMRGISLPNFQIYYSYSNQVCSISGERQTDQWNRMENPGTDPHKQLNDFDRTAQEFAGIKMTFPQTVPEQLGAHWQKTWAPWANSCIPYIKRRDQRLKCKGSRWITDHGLEAPWS